ncbi:hypothetical protein V8C86DRAFT_2572141 [Haematococcus lacustris]
MGVHNVEGRQNKCGHGVLMYTYPAWTFGGKRNDSDMTIGPGPGGRVPGIEFGGTGPAFGPPARTSAPPVHGPGVISGPSPEARGPAWSFGSRHPAVVDATPGPQAYRPHSAHVASVPSWGPPPRQRTLSAAREVRQPEVIQRKTKGPSFGLPHLKLTPPLSPGPQNYHPCDGACVACDSYHGKSMGLRPPMFYGKVTTVSPGPHYHVECSTLGAATQNCATGSSTFRRPKQTSPVTQPFSRKPYCPDGTC